LSNAVRKSLTPPDPKAKENKRPKDRQPLPLERFVPHDLRRSAASLMAAGGVSRFMLSRVLNHVEPGVTRVYDRHSYIPEMRAALDRWDELLREIVSGKPSKVVELKKAGAA